MTRTPILALALAALAAPAMAQENQPATESQETRPTNQTTQFTSEGLQEQNRQEVEQAAETQSQPENAMGEGEWSQGGTGALIAADGTQLGNVSIAATASGYALVTINAEGIPEGVHGVHVHQVGDCSGAGFESAGEHISGNDEHGVMTDTGPHPGDLPNITVAKDGVVAIDAFAPALTMDMVFDEDGSAVIIHADADDYTTQPGGNSGDRIACAAIQAAPGTEDDATVDSDEAQQQAPADAPANGETTQPAEGETDSNGG
ncbi:superoxide dismutase [Rubellimicrobium mesophilum DSM 19309]|uniref:Superoxide dismutase [Cu-Zn] n=1 Tax=Rubellimicrobium mesophilum DSM 19309 TaxID=442562 RepID=A0A017HB68_9RHOB|nr:superoxide dismutase family protein [Rubellimicrobium mesophilum]EYD71606.1 superoxide dismutase [Rubellimicrobium mesophilum DSM 19309]